MKIIFQLLLIKYAIWGAVYIVTLARVKREQRERSTPPTLATDFVKHIVKEQR